MATARVLVVDDDRAVRESLQRALQLEDLEVELAADGMQALARVQDMPPDLVVLDVMMPGVDGLGVVRRLRQDQSTSPCCCSPRGTPSPTASPGLDVGADDYLVKPFALEELLARVRALLRRRQAADDGREVLRVADVELDTAAMRARRGDRDLELTRTEYELLELFMANPERVLTRDVLHDRVWGYDAATSSNTLEVYVGYLRRKLEADGEPRLHPDRPRRRLRAAAGPRMSLRGRIATTAAGAVAIAVLLAFAGLYVVTARTLVGEVDRSLVGLVRDVGRAMDGGRPGPGMLRVGCAPAPSAAPAATCGRWGPAVRCSVTWAPTAWTCPVTDRVLAVARGEAPQFLATQRVDGSAFRVLTAPTRGDAAVQVARPLDEIEATLAALRRRLLLFGLLGIGLAAGLGTIVARGAVRPVNRLTEVAEEVAATQDLSRRIAVDGNDEVARLARSFDAMLTALEQARTAQEQLVADASHELRTPLTSLRTNIEVLARGERLDPAARRALIDDVVLQLDEFGRLVTGLVELARGDRPATSVAPVRLDHLVERVVARARTHGADGVEVVLDARPTTVRVEEDRVERAVSNLVDNAVKYAGADGPVEVTVVDGDCPRARPRPRVRRRGPPPCLRPLLPLGRRPGRARVGAGPVDRGPGRRGPRWPCRGRDGTRRRGGGHPGAAPRR